MAAYVIAEVKVSDPEQYKQYMAEAHVRLDAAGIQFRGPSKPRLGIGQLTLYCLSSENWKRPQAEVAARLQVMPPRFRWPTAM